MNERRLAAATTFLAVLVSTRAAASAPSLGAPSAPVPSSAGTGIDSAWATDTSSSSFTSLTAALPLLDRPGAFSLVGVGPVSFSNGLKAIGDFSTHVAMPFSPSGVPTGPGPNVVAHMTGAWAARAAGAYTLVVGSDDGVRVTLAGTAIISRPDPQNFTRAAASFSVPSAGLYPLEVDYFNGIEEGAVELSFARGEVALPSPYLPVPAAFTLVPRADLYPVSALSAPVDAGVDAAPVEAGVDAAPVDAAADAGPDASSVGSDADVDAAVDAPSDSSTPEASTDAAVDASSDAGTVAPIADDASESVDEPRPEDAGSYLDIPPTSIDDDAGGTRDAGALDETWRGGGCRVVSPDSAPLGWIPLLALGYVLARRRRARR